MFFLIFFSRGCNGSEEEEDLRRLTDEDEEMAEDFGIVVDSMVVDDVVVADDVVVTGDVVVVNDVVMTDDTVVEDDSSTSGFCRTTAVFLWATLRCKAKAFANL